MRNDRSQRAFKRCGVSNGHQRVLEQRHFSITVYVSAVSVRSDSIEHLPSLRESSPAHDNPDHDTIKLDCGSSGQCTKNTGAGRARVPAMPSIQDRTPEFRAILQQVQKRQPRSAAQRQSLLTEAEKRQNGDAIPSSTRSQFAREAASIGREITNTMGKLERLAQLARKKAIFDDRPVEINELTFVIKQDLARLNQQISNLQSLTASKHTTQPKSVDQEGQHNKQVVLLLQNKVTDVAANFKDVLEVRTKNIQASRSRTENFVSSVSARSTAAFEQGRSESPLYQAGQNRSAQASTTDLLSLDPGSGTSLLRGPQSDQQLMLMEEAQSNSYIQERGQAIDAIERTINELGSIFGQLAGMVAEQGEMLQRIDANTEDVVDNVQGAQRELLKYWNRVQGNRWLVAKMFGVLMIFFLLWVLISA